MDVFDLGRRLFGGARSKEPTNKSIINDAVKTYGSVREAARQLGISERHVYRLRSGQTKNPKPETRDRLRAVTRRTEVRATQRKPRRSNRLRSTGARVTISGQMWVDTPPGKKPDKRHREIEFDIGPDMMARLDDAYAAGDDEAYNEAWREAVEEGYGVGDWQMDDLDGFTLR